MDLSIGDRVFYTCSNGLQPPATVVGTAEDGLLHLEYYPPPPPRVVPHPLLFPGGGGSLGQPKIFRCVGEECPWYMGHGTQFWEQVVFYKGTKMG